MKLWIWIIVITLGLLHQDFWWWGDRTLLMNFLPIGLAYHVLFSIVAAGVWLVAVMFAWPNHVEQWADAKPEQKDTPLIKTGLMPRSISYKEMKR